MKPLNPNRANLLLLFTRDPFVKLVNKELEYYSSDNDSLIGFVSLDREDDSFHAMLFDRDSRNKYCLVSMKLDYFSIEEARLGLEKLMVTYVRNEKALKKELPTNDFFTPITKQEQRHPFFDKLLDKDGFFTAAKSVIEELSFHFEDRDGNFVNQFQSLNGFDARIWELYLWCYFREENFHFSYDFDAPDFMIEKMGYEVAIEAVHVNRKQSIEKPVNIPTLEEIQRKMEDEIPLMFGSPLYSKLKHTYHNQPYWELNHVKGKPLVYAIADFHADMSMTWSFPGIISILYGIDQKAIHHDDGTISLENEAGIVFQKGGLRIKPLFLDDQFKHVSAVLFSPCGTLSKFNRMGVQAGYGNGKNKLFQIKMCYNNAPDTILPNVFGTVVNDSCHETWADGIQIFHNPFAEIPLNPALFPHAGHHFYEDGLIRSAIPHNHIISTTTYNIKNLPFDPPSFTFQSADKFDEVIKKMENVNKRMMNMIPNKHFNTYKEGLDLEFLRAYCMEHGERRVMERGETLEEAGEPAQWVAFVERGCFKYMVHNDEEGKDYCTGFAFEGEFVSDFPYCLDGDMSEVSIEADMPCEVRVISGQELQALFDNDPKMAKMDVKILKNLFKMVYARDLDHYRYTARSRYRRLLERCPQVVQMLSLKDIASFLNVTPVYLSKIRKEITFGKEK